jgi:hypothetical protein
MNAPSPITPAIELMQLMRALILFHCLLVGFARGAEARPYQTNSIEGWTVLVDERLLAEHKGPTEKALDLLRTQLKEIVRVVPASAVAKLRQVTLWFSPEYPGVKPKAEYHPDAGWLRANGRNPAMAKGVEFTDVRDFEREMNRMPNFTLHELAHAYHDRVLPGGFDNAEIKAAFERAKAGKTYDKVERWFGNGRANTVERSYAMTNPMEYFAENTEAFFSRNDFFPFTRDELKRHDPEMEQLVARVWGVMAKPKSEGRDPKQIRGQKFEPVTGAARVRLGFGFRVSFGSRISSFGFATSPIASKACIIRAA